MRTLLLALGLSSILASGARAQLAPGDVPLIIVHGIDGSTAEPARLARKLARGRQLFPDIYAAEAEALSAGSVDRDAIFCFGYYKESATSPRFYTDRAPDQASIGGCPTPRTDPRARWYTISYAEQLERAVEGICRASGAEQVDLVGFSMGGIVSRAYTRWRSLRGPNGATRVRRLLTVASPNHGVNVIEATIYAAVRGHGPRAGLAWGELAELDADCRVWNGRGFLERLNDGWDAFCHGHGIVYAAGAARGFAWQSELRGLVPALTFLLGWIGRPILVHDVRRGDVARALAECVEDGDGNVRWRSARFDPAVYPHVLFNAPFRGFHTDERAPDRAPMEGAWAEALVRRFALERRVDPGFSTGSVRVEVVTAGHEASWLLLDVDVTGGTPLCARVQVRADAPRAGPWPRDSERFHGLLLRPGRQRLQLDPGIDGGASVRVDLYGADGELQLPATRMRFSRRGRVAPPRAQPDLGAPIAIGPAALLFPVSAGASPSEVAVGVDGVWTTFRSGAAALVPLPPPGGHEILLRARTAANAAGEWVEADRPDALRLIVEPSGRWSIRR